MPNVYAVNKTSYSISVNSWDIYYINNSNAELITVYNSNNNPYDCFKYILNNTPWFYVLDGIQNSWVNDLSNIGYSLTPGPVLPIVYSFSGTQTAASVAADASFDTGMEWDASKLYIGETNDGQGNLTRYGWEAEEGTPAPATQTAWLNEPGNTQSLPMYYGGNVRTYILYDENGNTLPTTSTYTLVGYHATTDGPLLSAEGTGIFLQYFTAFGYMRITSDGSAAAQAISIQRIEYTVS